MHVMHVQYAFATFNVMYAPIIHYSALNVASITYQPSCITFIHYIHCKQTPNIDVSFIMKISFSFVKCFQHSFLLEFARSLCMSTSSLQSHLFIFYHFKQIFMIPHEIAENAKKPQKSPKMAVFWPGAGLLVLSLYPKVYYFHSTFSSN